MSSSYYLVTFVALLTTLFGPAVSLREKSFQYSSGSHGKPNWSGVLHCPIDYDIQVKSLKISKPCSSFRCNQWNNYSKSKLESVRANCTEVSMCNLNLWQSSLTDGKDIKIVYECTPRRAIVTLFTDSLVKRFYHSSFEETTFQPEYCNTATRRKPRGIKENYIGRNEPLAPSFAKLLKTRTFFATHRLFGYFFDDQNKLGPVIQTSIRRNRRLNDGTVVAIPLYISADLKRRPSNTRKPFGEHITTYLEKCGKREDDDGGHLVAWTLGGPDEEFNLVPMARDLNRIQGIWYRMETVARKWLEQHPNGKIRWEVMMIYKPKLVDQPLRPVAFVLRYTEFESATDTAGGGTERIETFLNFNEEYRNDQCTFNMEDFFNTPDDDRYD